MAAPVGLEQLQAEARCCRGAPFSVLLWKSEMMDSPDEVARLEDFLPVEVPGASVGGLHRCFGQAAFQVLGASVTLLITWDH